MVDRVEEENQIVNREEESYSSAELNEQSKIIPEDGRETENFVEKIEKKGEMSGTDMTDDQSQTNVQQSNSDDDNQLPDDAVVLPMSQTQFEEGIHAPLVKAARWLAEWCLYMIKKFGKKVFFKG